MFKRRNPRSYGQIASDLIYPRGGWWRAGTYVLHRLRRLPDHPHRIGRGVGAGVGVSFTPFFGFHFLSGFAVAWVIRGNFLASALGTFAGNPLTIPFIAVLSLSTGRLMLGQHGRMGPQAIFGEFSHAGKQLWNNLLSPFTDRVAHWDKLAEFFDQIFLPYMLGGFVWGLIAGVIAHYLTVPVIRAHHKRRAKKMADRIARLRAMTAERERLAASDARPQ